MPVNVSPKDATDKWIAHYMTNCGQTLLSLNYNLAVSPAVNKGMMLRKLDYAKDVHHELEAAQHWQLYWARTETSEPLSEIDEHNEKVCINEDKDNLNVRKLDGRHGVDLILEQTSLASFEKKVLKPRIIFEIIKTQLPPETVKNVE